MAKTAKNRTLVKKIILLAFGFVAFGSFAILGTIGLLEQRLPSVKSLSGSHPQGVTRVLSSDGKLVATLYRENRTPLKRGAIGDNVVKALLSIEDHRFYQHHGVDWKGVARAAFRNLGSGDVGEGASTLTMQLARHLYLDSSVTWKRKVQEALLARRIESIATKDEILVSYLNEVYFGAGAYGVGAASSRFFRKPPTDLSLAESALLVGLLQSPTFLNPIRDPDAAKSRQHEVLLRMRDLGTITEAQYDRALTESNSMSFAHLPEHTVPMLKYPYFTTFAIAKLSSEVGEEALYKNSLTVRTTLDLKAQQAAELILKDVLATRGGQMGVTTGAVVVVENETGYVRAMVGGDDWTDKNQFNRAWQAHRQPGSTFKPFVYATALESGYQPFSLILDAPLNSDTLAGSTWRPANYDGRGLGLIPLREALAQSRNQATAQLMAQVGPSSVSELAHRFGIESDLPEVPSLALGSGVVTPLEMASAYTVFANNGWLVENHAVIDVVSNSGKRVVDHQHPWIRQASTSSVAAQMTDLLLGVVDHGTGQNAKIPGLSVAGKTGTTDANKDAWFVGFTPTYTVAVWMGNDDNTPTSGLYGGSLPAEVFRRVMSSLYQKKTHFDSLSQSATKLTLCGRSHQLAGPYCSTSYLTTTYLPVDAAVACRSCYRSYPRGTQTVYSGDPSEMFPAVYTYEDVGGY